MMGALARADEARRLRDLPGGSGRLTLFSVSYAIFQLAQGLLLHPYQTVQMVVEEKVFSWMALTPTFVLAVVTILWRGGVVPLVRLVFSCSATPVVLCDWLPFFSTWITFFCLYWQVLLLYLLFRFRAVFR